MSFRIRRAGVPVALLVALFGALSACGSDGTSTSATDRTTVIGEQGSKNAESLLVSDATNPEAGDRPVVLWFWAPG